MDRVRKNLAHLDTQIAKEKKVTRSGIGRRLVRRFALAIPAMRSDEEG